MEPIPNSTDVIIEHRVILNTTNIMTYEAINDVTHYVWNTSFFIIIPTKFSTLQTLVPPIHWENKFEIPSNDNRPSNNINWTTAFGNELRHFAQADSKTNTHVEPIQSSSLSHSK